ncbi:MAG: hypothetical protein ACI8XM_000013 [Haloarculaceae archaeon]|jgi:hypothetical protein
MSEPDSDAVVSYDCPAAGQTHTVPGEDIRVLRVGDGGFVIACACSDEGLDVVDEPPHPSVDHLVNVYADDPSPEEWLRLEAAADGWHDTTAWTSPDGYPGTNGQRRAQFREQVEALVDDVDGRDLEPSKTQKQALEYDCPSCGATSGRKCQRPSGHRVRTPHAARTDLVDDSEPCTDTEYEQATLC